MTKAKQDKSKKIWKVVALPVPKKKNNATLLKFAADMERKLNELSKEGYSVTPWKADSSGMLLVGKSLDINTLQLPFFSQIPMQERYKENEGVELKGKYSDELFSYVFDNLNPNALPEEQSSFVSSAVTQVFKRADASELQTTLSDCDRVIEEHSKAAEHQNDDSAGECHVTKTMDLIKVAIQNKLQLQVS